MDSEEAYSIGSKVAARISDRYFEGENTPSDAALEAADRGDFDPALKKIVGRAAGDTGFAAGVLDGIHAVRKNRMDV